MILREFPAGDPAAADEERALSALDTLGDLAPRLLARSTVADGEPSWVLISRLPRPSRHHPRRPTHLDDPTRRRPGAYPQCRRTVAANLDTVFNHPGYRARPFGPAAHIVGNAWENKIATTPTVLTHGDYQSGNIIRDNGTLTGITDWEGASRSAVGLLGRRPRT